MPIKPSSKPLPIQVELEVLAQWEETMRLVKEDVEKNRPKKRVKKTPASQ